MDPERKRKLEERRAMVDYLDHDPQARDVLTALHDKKRCQRQSLETIAPGRVEGILTWMMGNFLIVCQGSFVVINDKGIDLYDKIRPKKQRSRDETGNLFTEA